MKKILTLILSVLCVCMLLTACSDNDKNKIVKTCLGEGEIIPLKNGLGEILEDKYYIKIPCDKEPSHEKIIEVYNELNSKDLNFNYFLITFGNSAIHFAKDNPIGSEGQLDNNPDSIQPGSQIEKTEKYLKIENNSITVEKKE